MTIPAIGTQIWASTVKPGFIISIPGESDNLPVYDISENYATFTFSDGIRSYTVDYGSMVTVKGYFNK